MAYTSFERSINARKQRRDRYGRWVFMGGSINFSHGGKRRTGIIKNFDGDYAITEYKNDSGQTTTVKKHRSEFVGINKKATLTPETKTPKTQETSKKATLKDGAHDNDPAFKKQLTDLGFSKDEADAIAQADTRQDARNAWDATDTGKALNDEAASAKMADMLQPTEKARLDRFEAARAEMDDRFEGEDQGIFQDSYGNYQIPQDQIQSIKASELKEGDLILSKGEFWNPNWIKTGETDYTTGELLTYKGRRSENGQNYLDFEDESGNNKEVTFFDSDPEFIKAETLFEGAEFEDPEGQEDPSAPDKMMNATNWERTGGQQGSNKGGTFKTLSLIHI